MAFPRKGIIRIAAPLAVLHLLAAVPRNARAVPGPFYRGTTIGGYSLTLPLTPSKKMRLGIRELMFSFPVATLGKPDTTKVEGGRPKPRPKIVVGGVAGRAGILEMPRRTDTKFAKVGVTAGGLRVWKVGFDLGARGKIYDDPQAGTSGGADFGARVETGQLKREILGKQVEVGPLNLESTVFDLWRPRENVTWKAVAGLELPAGFSVEGIYNTESRGASIAASKIFVLKKGEHGEPVLWVAPEFGRDLKSWVNYQALAAQVGPFTAVGVREPYRDEERGWTTTGTHFILSIDLAKLFPKGRGEKQPPLSEWRERALESAGAERASLEARELRRMRR